MSLTMNQLKLNIAKLHFRIDTSGLKPWVFRELSENFSSFINYNGDISDETLEVVTFKTWKKGRIDPVLETVIKKCLKNPLEKFPFRDDPDKDVADFFKYLKSFFIDKRFRSFIEGMRGSKEIVVYPVSRGCLLRKGQPARSALFIKTGFFRGPQINSICEAIHISASMALPIKGSIMLHGVGMRRQGIGHLFLGPSGGGKSTIAQMSPPEDVISDDGIIVEKGVSGFNLAHAPIDQSIFYRDNSKMRIPGNTVLNMGFFLKKDNSVYLEEVSPSDACSIILKNHIHYFRYFPPKSVENSFSLISDLCRNVPFYRLHFRKDSTFWSVIDKEIKKVYSSQETDNGLNKKRQEASL